MIYALCIMNYELNYPPFVHFMCANRSFFVHFMWEELQPDWSQSWRERQGKKPAAICTGEPDRKGLPNLHVRFPEGSVDDRPTVVCRLYDLSGFILHPSDYLCISEKRFSHSSVILQRSFRRMAHRWHWITD